MTISIRIMLDLMSFGLSVLLFSGCGAAVSLEFMPLLVTPQEVKQTLRLCPEENRPITEEIDGAERH